MNDSARPKKSRGLLALSPLAVFLCLYLGTSLAAGDFYKVAIAVAFLAASVYSVLRSRGEPLAERIRHFPQGASHHYLMLMIWIFVLAGAFARSAEATGAVDATVGLPLRPKKIASLPACDTPRVIEALKGVWDFVPVKNVFEAAIHADNVVMHLATTVLSATRIEAMRDNFILFQEGFTPASRRCAG